MNTALHFSSGKDDWQTPRDVFDPLRNEFAFGIDLAASPESDLVGFYFGPHSKAHTDALAEECKWHKWAGDGWCNPPYSRGKQAKFIAKAAAERLKGFTTVMLLPARPDTRAFHEHIWDRELNQPRPGIEVRFLRGRIKFVGAKHAAPFPSMVVVFRGA